MKKKLRKILNEFDFVDVQTALSTIDWDKTPIIDINHKKYDLLKSRYESCAE